ncbi:MAG: AAA-like domain-containing protein [Xenococcaceae cyanobacterium]
MSDLPSVKTILILSANPKGTTQLRLDEEVREIKEGFRRSNGRNNFEIITASAVRPRDIQRSILDNNPQIVHFSGHGTGEEGLAFEDNTGQVKLVDAEALAGLFELFAEQVKCVVLNACYSQVQASALAQHIPYVVGMNKAIGERAAIEFSVSFYEALGADKDYVFAHKLGCSAVRMAGIKENLTPVLIQLKSSSPPINPQPNKPVSNGRKLVAVAEEKVASQDNCINVDYYINRPPIEANCFQEIEQQGGLLRIKAPQKMGKTLLLKKVFEYVEPKNYRRVRIDLHQLESSILSDSSKFLQWLCRRVSKRLKLSDCLESDWGGMTPNTGCTDYFEEYILESLETPLLLAIDNIDRLFSPELQSIGADFFGLLRSWWGEAQTTGGNWTKLRLIVIYSTEDLPKLNIHQSPFNVGTEIKLPDFDDEQVQQLAFRYGLNWSLIQVQQLKEQIGGHPYLVHQAIKNLKMNPELTLTQLLDKAATDEGIYAHHLQHHWSTLEQEPTLARQLKTIVEADEPIAIAPAYLYRLDSMGLIAKVRYQVQPRCQLYCQYFRERLLTLNDS